MHADLASDPGLTAVDDLALQLDRAPSWPALNPITFLYAHHRVQHELCATLWRIADDMNDGRMPALAAHALTYLVDELPLHHAHEEDDIPTALAIPADTCREAEQLFGLVARGHHRDQALAEQALEGLSVVAEGGFPAKPGRFVITLMQLAESLRLHIEWEDRVALPFMTDLLPPRAAPGLLAWMAQRRSLWLAAPHGRPA